MNRERWFRGVAVLFGSLYVAIGASALVTGIMWSKWISPGEGPRVGLLVQGCVLSTVGMLAILAAVRLHRGGRTLWWLALGICASAVVVGLVVRRHVTSGDLGDFVLLAVVAVVSFALLRPRSTAVTEGDPD